MTLTRAQIVDAAHRILAEDGLPGLTMRRLAQALSVQPGATYYHIASKQDLLVAVAERILDPTLISNTDPATCALDVRAVLLPVRDSADIVSFAHAFHPEVLAPFRSLEELFMPEFPPRQARWAAQTLVHYVLGFVAQEQNQNELVRAGILDAASAPELTAEAFRFGVAAILRGLRP